MSGQATRDWLAMAPVEIQQEVADALGVAQEHRTRLIAALVGNVRDEELRRRLAARYAQTPLAELEDMLLLARPDLVGNAGQPPIDPDDILPLPPSPLAANERQGHPVDAPGTVKSGSGSGTSKGQPNRRDATGLFITHPRVQKGQAKGSGSGTASPGEAKNKCHDEEDEEDEETENGRLGHPIGSRGTVKSGSGAPGANKPSPRGRAEGQFYDIGGLFVTRKALPQGEAKGPGRGADSSGEAK